MFSLKDEKKRLIGRPVICINAIPGIFNHRGPEVLTSKHLFLEEGKKYIVSNVIEYYDVRDVNKKWLTYMLDGIDHKYGFHYMRFISM